MVKFLRIKLKTSLSSLEDGVSKTEVAHPKSFSHRQAVSVCNDGSVLTKLTGQFLETDKDSKAPSSDQPKRVLTATGCPPQPLRNTRVQNISGESVPINKVTVRWPLVETLCRGDEPIYSKLFK